MRPALLLTTATLALALALGACDPAQRTAPVAPSATPAAAQVPSQLPRNVRPLHYSISAAPDAANLRFASSVAIDIEVIEATDTITLNAADLTFSSVTLDGDRRARV